MPARTWLVKSSMARSSITEIGFTDVFVVRDVLGIARHHDPSGFVHQGLVGEFKRQLRVLLPHQHVDLVRAVSLTDRSQEVTHDTTFPPHHPPPTPLIPRHHIHSTR